MCEDYNGVVSKVLGDGWLNLRILSVQSLEAHHRATIAWSCLYHCWLSTTVLVIGVDHGLNLDGEQQQSGQRSDTVSRSALFWRYVLMP